MKNQLSLLVFFLSANFLAPSYSFGQVSEFAELEAEYASQTGTAYTIVFDDSGSMEGQKIREAKQAFAWWLEKAGPNNAWCFLPLNRRYLDVEFVKNGEAQVIRAVKNLEVGGITPIVDTLALAYEKIKTRRETVTPYERHLVIILTDGAETKDPGGNPAVCKSILGLREKGIEVFGIGFHGEGSYLDGFASHYVAANNREELQRSLSQVDAEVPLNIEFRISAEEKKAMALLATMPAGKTPQINPDGVSFFEDDGETDAMGFIFVVLVFVAIGAVALVLVAKKS